MSAWDDSRIVKRPDDMWLRSHQVRESVITIGDAPKWTVFDADYAIRSVESQTLTGGVANMAWHDITPIVWHNNPPFIRLDAGRIHYMLKFPTCYALLQNHASASAFFNLSFQLADSSSTVKATFNIVYADNYGVGGYVRVYAPSITRPGGGRPSGLSMILDPPVATAVEVTKIRARMTGAPTCSCTYKFRTCVYAQFSIGRNLGR